MSEFDIHVQPPALSLKVQKIRLSFDFFVLIFGLGLEFLRIAHYITVTLEIHNIVITSVLTLGTQNNNFFYRRLTIVMYFIRIILRKLQQIEMKMEKCEP